MTLEVAGEGTEVVLLPGSNKGLRAFPEQLSLSEGGHRLVTPAPRTEIPARIDFEEDAANLDSVLGETPAHIVAHSYGGLTAIHLAALRATRVRSLVLIEPAALSVARGVPEVEHHIQAVEEVFARARGGMTTEQFADAFAAALGSAPRSHQPLLEAARLELELLRRRRLPWSAELPVAEVRAATYPKLVVTSGSDPIYEAVADRLAPVTRAEREVLEGTGHRVQDAATFNELLRRFTGGPG